MSSKPFTFLDVARGAMPLMNEAERAEAERLIGTLQDNTPAETLQEFKRRAAEAFEEDMQPIVSAVVAALKSDDRHAWEGLRAMLPHLLEQVNEAPALADLLAHQLGKTILQEVRGA